jgi:uncharacterized protein (UPF0335 family)
MKQYQQQIHKLTQKLEDLQLEQSSLKGEIRQLEQQLSSYGIDDSSKIDAFISLKKQEQEKIQTTLENLIEQVEGILNDFED